MATAANTEAELRRRVGEDAARSFHQSKVERTHQQALEQDPSVFDYDGVYDDMTSERQEKASKRKAQRESEKKQPKYIATLMEKAKIREIENERIRDKRLLNERKQEDALYEGKEKFISASYKRHLMERKKWDEEDARLDAIEEAEDVTKRGERGMADFYANLLNNNIAMGGAASTLANSAYTAGRAGGEDDRGSSSEDKKGSKQDDDGGEGERRRKHESRDEPMAKKRRTGGEADEEREEQSETERSVAAPPTNAVASSEPEAKPSKDDVISAAKARFLARKAMRTAAATANPQQ